MTTATPAPVWKRTLAAVLDLTTDSGFALSGAPALALFVIIVAYFIVGRRFAGGTIWDRILGIARPQPY